LNPMRVSAVSRQKLARGFAQKVAKLKFSPLWSCEEIGIGRSPPCITARRGGRALKKMIAKPPLIARPGWFSDENLARQSRNKNLSRELRERREPARKRSYSMRRLASFA